jgi:ssDNA-binding Zn-finger/Zn-ribbon topoisomerase 1
MSIEETLCPSCKIKMIPRNSKFGKFWGCPNYPICKETRDSMGLSKEEKRNRKSESEEEEDE